MTLKKENYKQISSVQKERHSRLVHAHAAQEMQPRWNMPIDKGWAVVGLTNMNEYTDMEEKSIHDCDPKSKINAWTIKTMWKFSHNGLLISSVYLLIIILCVRKREMLLS